MSAGRAHPFTWEEWGRLDAIAIGEHVQRGDIAPTEAAEQARQAMALVNPQLNALLEDFAPVSSEAAADRQPIAGGLHGAPIVFKDLGSGIAGKLQEQGSALYRGHYATQTDPLAANLIACGVSIVGRAATAELGMAFDTSTTYDGLFVTRNPWHSEYTPGGSSGGSAALVAAGAIPAAHGTDGAGSIRIPAALTGLIGLKVTRGFLPPPWRFNEYANPGMVEGFLTRSVRDTAALLDAGSRHFPPGNSFISPRQAPESLLGRLEAPLPALRIGIATGRWGRPGTQTDAASQALTRVAAQLASHGHRLEEVDDQHLLDWPSFWEGFRAFWLGIRPQAWPAGKGASLTPILQHYREAAQAGNIQTLLTHQQNINRSSLKIATLFKRFDLLLCPVFGRDHTRANAELSTCRGGDVDAFIDTFIDAGRYTIPANETGLPAISWPAGFDHRGLPLAVQFYAPWHEELRLLQLARSLEQASGGTPPIPPVHIARAAI